MSCYLAGPFFNGTQLRVVTQMEHLLDECKVSYYSPRQDPANAKSGDRLTDTDAARIYKSNVDKIRQATMVVAQLDFPMDPGHQLQLRALNHITPVRLPDPGTVFEIGHAAALNIPVVGLVAMNCVCVPVEDLSKMRANIMLTQACSHVLYGWSQFEQWVREGIRLQGNKWQGQHQ